jgi:hypothetical protein
MAWPGDAAETAGQTTAGKGGLDILGLVFGAGPEIMPLTPRIKAAIETAERYQNDPEIKKLIAESPEVVAFVKKVMADPAIKDALAVAAQVMGILAKHQG